MYEEENDVTLFPYKLIVFLMAFGSVKWILEPSSRSKLINFTDADSLISSVFGLKAVPKMVTVFLDIFPFNKLFN